MSGRIYMKQSTTGWQPLARRGSSWVEINLTLQTWWGNTPASLRGFYVHCTCTCTLVHSEISWHLLDKFPQNVAMEKFFNHSSVNFSSFLLCRLCLASSEWWKACRRLTTWWRTPRSKTGTDVWRERRSTTRAPTEAEVSRTDQGHRRTPRAASSHQKDWVVNRGKDGKTVTSIRKQEVLLWLWKLCLISC